MPVIASRQKMNRGMYEAMYQIRSAELAIMQEYPSDAMKTPMHMSMGEEAIVVGVSQALGRDAHVLGTYRSHALYLARARETDKFFAELFGKSTGLVQGRGGSMHLVATHDGLLGTSAIVGSTISVATGVAYAHKLQKDKTITAVFFGDGAVDEGTFWESLNVACLMKLPIMFVCEDNGFAVHVPKAERHGYDSLSKNVASFRCDVYDENSTDVEKLYKTTQQALTVMKRTGRPAFLHFNYYRYLEHVGVNEDFDAGYRSKDEYQRWRKKDPIETQRIKLLKLGMSEQSIKRLERAVDDKVAASVTEAKKAPFADPKKVFDHLFA